MLLRTRPLRAVQDVFRRLTNDDGRLFRHRLLSASPPRLSAISGPELLGLPARHDELILRHGRAAVLGFYEQELARALDRLPDEPSVRSSRCTMALRALGTASAFGPSEQAVEWARRALQAAARGPLEADRAADRERKRALRKDIASRLRPVVVASQRAGGLGVAKRGLELLDRLGEISREERATYTRLLVAAGDGSPAALVAYLKYLADPTGDPSPAQIRELLLHHAGIEEHTAPGVARTRLRFNQALVLAGDPGGRAALSVGRGHLLLGEPERALEFLQLAQARDDVGGLASFHLAQALFELGRFDAAADAFQRAIDHSYDRARVLAWQALANAKAGRYEQAFTMFRDAEVQLGSSSLTSEFFVFWGRACFLNGALNDAEARFRRALELNAAEWRAVNGIAACLMRLDRPDEAVDTLDGWVARAPEPAPATSYLAGRLLQSRGRLKDAARHYHAATAGSPEDHSYQLALGLLLDDLGEPAAAGLLRRAAELSPSPEVLRRLTRAAFARGDREEGRGWLMRLRARAPGAHVLAFHKRDLVSQADEAFNAGDFAAAARLLSGLAGALARDPRVRERLGLALGFAAARDLRGDRVVVETWTDIARAAELADAPAVQFLVAFASLVRGEYDLAREQFAALAEHELGDAPATFFAALSAQLAGEPSAAEQLDRFGSPAGSADLHALLGLLRAHAAAAAGNHRGAAESFLAWASDPDRIRRLGLPRHHLNEFAACCLKLGVARAIHIPRHLAQLREKAEDYWDLAGVLVKHLELLQRGTGVTLSDVEACEGAYEDLIRRTPRDELPHVVEHYASWLEFVVLVRLARQEVAEAMEVFASLAQLTVPLSDPLSALRKHLESRLRDPSHEAAFALFIREPERAREIWETLCRRDSADLEAVHHLACLHWSRAYDEVQAGRFEASLDSWREGFRHYQRLYESDAWWARLREKGRALQQPGFVFDESAFEAWRRDALRDRVVTLLDLIGFFLTEVGPTNRTRATGLGKGIMEILRNLPPDGLLTQWASGELARRRLPTGVRDWAEYPGVKERAQQIIDIDPTSVPARQFLVRSAAHVAHERFDRREEEPAVLVSMLEDVKRHADWLFERRDQLPDPPGVGRDLCGYWDELGRMLDQKGQADIARFNAVTPPITPAKTTTLRGYLLATRQAFQASDEAWRRSIAIEPTNFAATHDCEYHQTMYPRITQQLQNCGG